MQSPIASNALAFLTSILFQGCDKQAQTVFLKFQFSMGIAVKRYNFLKVVNLHTYIYIDITYIFIHLHVCIFPELWSVTHTKMLIIRLPLLKRYFLMIINKHIIQKREPNCKNFLNLKAFLMTSFHNNF